MEGAPPAYFNTRTPTSVPYEKGYDLGMNTVPTSMQMASTPETKHRFPKEFGFYHASGSFSDLMIAQHADDRMLWYISTHNTLSSQPSVVLHSTPNSSAPPLATADFHSFSTKVDIGLFTPHGVQMSTLENTSAFSSTKVFQAIVAQTNATESFEWKRSRGNEVAILQGRSHGMKLVRKSTGQVVAAWAKPNMGTKKRGKMVFLADRDALGEDFELMAVITMLAIMEHARRRNNGAAASGAAGAS